MRIIGITGGIGSGKSTVARELANRGYAVYDCDREAKRIITEDERVRQQIISLLGAEAFADGKYNTDYVSRRVFAAPELLDALNGIVHPAVVQDILRQTALVLFVESAILFESEIDRLCEQIIIVDAPEKVRLERTIARDYHGKASEENINNVRARMRAQAQSFGVKRETPVIRIENDGRASISELAEQIIARL
jgi:dephospho-CoA kinase